MDIEYILEIFSSYGTNIKNISNIEVMDVCNRENYLETVRATHNEHIVYRDEEFEYTEKLISLVIYEHKQTKNNKLVIYLGDKN